MITNITSEPMDVRLEVARDPNTDPSILATLAEDNSLIVRYLVFLNPNIPIDVLNALRSQFILRARPSYILSIDFSHEGRDADSGKIYSNVEQIVTSFGGELLSCRVFGTDPVLDNDYTYVSSITIEFVLDDAAYCDGNGNLFSLDLKNFVGDEIETMLVSLGYGVESSDWF